MASLQSPRLIPASPTLLGIPPEIRIRIYQHLFPRGLPYYLSLCPLRWDGRKSCPPRDNGGKPWPCWHYRAHRTDPALRDVRGLIHSCRKIYLETINILYSSICVITFSPYATMNFFQTIWLMNTLALKQFVYQLDPSPLRGTAGQWCAFFKALLESPVGTTGGTGAAGCGDWDRYLHFFELSSGPVFGWNKETGDMVIRETSNGGRNNDRSPHQPASKVLYWEVQAYINIGGSPFGILPAGEVVHKMRFTEDVENNLLNGLYDEEAYRVFTDRFSNLFGQPDTEELVN